MGTSTGHLLQFVGQTALPYHDRLVYAAGEDPVEHGGTFTADDATFALLTEDPNVGPVLQEVTTDYSSMSRAELEQAASDAGIENSDDLEVFPTNGSLAVAIEVSQEDTVQSQTTSVEAEVAPEAQEAPPTPEEGGAE